MKRRDEGNGEASEPLAERGQDGPGGDEAAAARADEGARADSEDAPATLPAAQERIEALIHELAQQEAANGQLRDQLLRERAEVENFKRRMAREKSEAIRYASEPLLRDLLPAIDNLERALAAAGEASQAGGPTEALRSGVAMVAQQLREVLPRHGVTRIEAAGQPFDPNEHEALAHVVTTRTDPGAVLDEHLPGYRLHERLLRAAQVTVAKSPVEDGN